MYLSIANFITKITFNNSGISLPPQYIEFLSRNTKIADYLINVESNTIENTLEGTLLFEANYSLDDTEIFWQIRKKENLHIFYFGDFYTKKFPLVKAITADHKHWNIVTSVISNSNYNPFPHPVGDVLFVHILSQANGIAMHASAVESNGKAYLFTGFSGVGKSTIANLWKDNGAQIINDDRIYLQKDNSDRFIAYNSPMPYYTDAPRQAPLAGIFLLNQAPQNGYRKLEGVRSLARVSAHCLQHNYSKEFVTNTLKTVTELISNVPVYELDVYPSKDIVSLVKSLV